MAHLVKLPSTQTKFYGTFSLEDLISVIKAWFLNQQYDLAEIARKEKQGDFGFDVESKFLAEKEVTSYVKFNCFVFIAVNDMKDVEVVKDGKKIKMKHGRVRVELWGSIDFDWQKRWEKTKFLKALEDFYQKYIFRHEKEIRWVDKYYYQLYGLQKEIRHSLGMEA